MVLTVFPLNWFLKSCLSFHHNFWSYLMKEMYKLATWIPQATMIYQCKLENDCWSQQSWKVHFKNCHGLVSVVIVVDYRFDFPFTSMALMSIVENTVCPKASYPGSLNMVPYVVHLHDFTSVINNTGCYKSSMTLQLNFEWLTIPWFIHWFNK